MEEKEKKVRGAVIDLLGALMERDQSLAPKVRGFLHRVAEGSDLSGVLLKFTEELREECRRKVV